MTPHLRHHHHDDPLDIAGRRGPRTVVVTAAAVGVAIASIAVVDTDSPPDTGPEQIALGSTWS